ncbi:MAG: methyltransferase domain-containing protein, partial [Candidatus Solibacter sp.]
HLLAVAAHHGYRVVGVEVNPELVSLSRRWGLHVVTSLDDVAPGVDVITFIDSFYYVEHPYETLCAARTKLREGGFVLLRVTNRNWIATLRRRFAGDDLSLLGDALFSYSPGALRKLLERSGFVVTKVVPDHGVGKALGWPKRAAYTLLQVLTTLSANRIPLAPGIIAIAAPAGGIDNPNPRWSIPTGA